MEDEQYQCGTCEKSVPISNRTMHSLVCERREAPRRAAAERVTEGSGADVELPTVNGIVEKGVEPDSVEVHAASAATSSTPAPPPGAPPAPAQAFMVECEFCDLPVQVQSLEEHSAQCGGRTDVCELCLNYVRLRDMRTHKDSGCAVASTGSAMRSALEEGYENEPLLGNPQGRARVRAEGEETSSWTPVAVAVGAVAAAAAMSLLVRRR